MYSLRMLGGIGLTRGDGVDVDALLRQPKRVAVLAFLSLPRPGTWHRRDTLLLTFWPDLDQSRARSSLRSMLHSLRRHLPEGVVRTRGDEEVGLDPSLISTDVSAMLEEAASGRHADALARYAGDFLSALHVSDAEVFEQWIEQERHRLKTAAVKIAGKLAKSLEETGDFAGAVDAARRAVELDPFDEGSVRQLIRQLHRAGDRAQALVTYDRFRERLRAELGASPSRETAALVEELRGTDASTSSVRPSPPHSYQLSVDKQSRVALGSWYPAVPQETLRAIDGQRHAHRRWRMALTVGAALIMLVTAVASVMQSGDASLVDTSELLVILPLENGSQKGLQDSVAARMLDGVSRRLGGIGRLTIRSLAFSPAASALSNDVRTMARGFKKHVTLRTTISDAGDSLVLRASLVWPDSAKDLAPQRFVPARLPDVESKLVAAIVGGLFRKPLRGEPSDSTHAIKPESFRLMTAGWHAMLELKNPELARELFRQATDADPNNAGAWTGLSSAWGLLTIHSQVEFQEGFARAEQYALKAIRLDSGQGSAYATLAVLATRKYGRLSAGEELMRKAKRAEPGNPEIFIIQRWMYEHAHLWDEARDAMRIAHELEPGLFWNLPREVGIEVCAGQLGVAREMLYEGLRLNPLDTSATNGLVRMLARLGRYDEAIETWRSSVEAEQDLVLLNALSNARGARGYWDARHIKGSRSLAKIRGDTSPGWKSEFVEMQASFSAGDSSAGFRLLEKLADEGEYALYRLPCMLNLDEVRDTPHFKAILARVGPLPR